MLKEIFHKIVSAKNKPNQNKIIDYNQLLNDIIIKQSYINQRLLIASNLNQKAFAQYKGVFREKEVVLVAAGPTVNDFVPMKDAVYVGCNRAFLFDKIDFDFLFAIDKVGIKNYYKEIFEYRKNECVKFIGDQNIGKHFQIPEDIISLNDKTYRYITTAGIEPLDYYYPLDISLSPLLNSTTVSLQAMQFILWTQPKRIYIVGVDCTCASKQHFTGSGIDCSYRNENTGYNDNKAIELYIAIKEFAQTYYPTTEIISVNPVGLKGIFKDVYTNSYVEKHKEIFGQDKIEYI